MTKIIADIGATNSRWLVSDKNGIRRLDGKGYNPFTHERATWQAILSDLNISVNPSSMALYGAGFVPEMQGPIADDVKAAWPQAQDISLYTDLLGACRGMAGQSEGVVVIMGTGANTCLYDGKDVVKNIEPMGFALGGEGSAFSIGRAVVRAVIRDKLPRELKDEFKAQYAMTDMEIVMRAHQPQGNRFLGQFAKFASRHIDHPYMNDLVTKALAELFDVLRDYHAADRTHYFTGSIAVHFEPILATLCAANGVTDYRIVPDIMDGLARFHRLAP